MAYYMYQLDFVALSSSPRPVVFYLPSVRRERDKTAGLFIPV